MTARNYLSTGGARSRTMTAVINGLHQRGPWLEIDAGGPLDAPELMPAGAMNSTECRRGPWHLNNGTGQPSPSQSECTR
jgi:hypothetical protein